MRPRKSSKPTDLTIKQKAWTLTFDRRFPLVDIGLAHPSFQLADRIRRQATLSSPICEMRNLLQREHPKHAPSSTIEATSPDTILQNIKSNRVPWLGGADQAVKARLNNLIMHSRHPHLYQKGVDGSFSLAPWAFLSASFKHTAQLFSKCSDL